MSVIDRLKAAGVNLPSRARPSRTTCRSSSPATCSSSPARSAPTPDGLIKGRLGEDMTLEQGQQAARTCAINLIAQMQAALGDLERVTRIVKLGGFVNAAARLHRHPESREWLLGPDGRGVRRQGPPRPLRRRLPRPADGRRGGSRRRRRVRMSRDALRRLGLRLRPSRAVGRGVPENSLARFPRRRAQRRRGANSMSA